MPLALLIIGAIVLLVAIRGTHAELGKLLVDDFTGTGGTGFFVWLGAIGFVAALGFVPALKTPSRILLAIIIFGLIMSNQGAISKIGEAFKNPPAAEPAKPAAESKLPGAIPVEVVSAAGGKGGGSNPVADVLGTAAKIAPFVLA